MTRSEILAEVEAMILADMETAAILERRLEQMGLEERVPGDRETWRSTPLGRELHSHLLMVFLGLWDEWEVPVILQDYGVIDDLECEAIWGFLEKGRDAEAVLKKYVRDAHFSHTIIEPSY